MATTRRLVGSATGTPLNRTGLIAAVAEQADLTSAKAAEAVDALFSAVQAALQDGREVRLTGFGSFVVAQRKASTGRNPRTGAAIEIGPSSTVRFKPGRGLKDAVGR